MAKKENKQEAVNKTVVFDYRLIVFWAYIARLAKAETVNTMRRDRRAIFKDVLDEAKVAADVFIKDKQENEGHE